ncbi:dnaJ homolog subfamily C GRV2-like [Sesamum indicum]|uniref:DnaJ homolog subfamily C GRV2-like n=1 Tax=Sesamum indicum TaxID=4182 RepID=A0A8M8V4P1_SESIN|nr:dnaJ homolog subfamily C GRV2-like [Sesamum indicum]
MLEFSGLVDDIVHCTELELVPAAIDAALQTIAHLSISSEIQNALLKAGVLWYLIPLLLQYDSTAEESDKTDAHGVGTSVQIAKNLHAVKASHALSRLSGLVDEEIPTPYNQAAADALRALLTPKLASMLKNKLAKDLLFTLNSNLESPEIIWNSSTRAELLKFVEEQRASLSHHGSYDLKDSHSFVYEALSKELYIGNVYLRVYNDQPDFEITEPEDFCLALVDFISHLVHNAPAASMDTHVNSDVTTDGSAEQHSSDDSSASLDGKSLEREDLELVKNLQYGLLSLQHLLTKNPNLASVVSTKEKLLPLFECFSLPVSSSSNIPQLCLLVLSRLTTYAPCVEAMVADSSGLLILLQLLHSSPSCREGALHVLP